MSKEEYAQLYCLLGKLKYSIGELYNVRSLNNLNSDIQKIDALLTLPLIMDGKSNWIKAEDVVLNEKD